MYLQQHFRKKGNKTYQTVYLAESYREDGKVKKRYIANLSDWLCENQEKIEKKLFPFRNKNNTEAKTVYLYDVASSYFEGTQNELAAFGYSRDKKQGKMQVADIFAIVG